MKLLLTGASGFLGGKLCLALLAEGYSVRALVRRNSDLIALRPTDGGAELPHGLELVYGDITNLESLVKSCEGCEALFHVAALVEQWLPDPSRFYTVSSGLVHFLVKISYSIKRKQLPIDQ
jgi:NAD+-dependent farnesol dehydrogenase